MIKALVLSFLCLECICSYIGHDETTLSVELLSKSDRSECTDQQRNYPYNNEMHLLKLPLDTRMSIIDYLQKKDIHSLMRSSKSHLNSCRQWIHHLLSVKFDYLLAHNCSRIKIKHLLNVPIVDQIKMNACDMARYFHSKQNKSSTSSKYIGIDINSSSAFISLWMKKVRMDDPQGDIVTIVLNDSRIHYFHFSDPFPQRSTLQFWLLGNNDLDIREICDVLLTGKVRDISDNNALWCLNDQWESCMFWPRVKAEMASFNKRVTVIYLLLLFALWIIAMTAIVVGFVL